MSEENLNRALENARQDLEKYVKEPGPYDFCFKYALEVLYDKKVQEHFLKHFKEEDWGQLTCHPGLGREIIVVVFTFRCRPPKICIVPPAFAVHYNIVTKTVVDIIDPYVYGGPV
jgi:hypothetical protein